MEGGNKEKRQRKKHYPCQAQPPGCLLQKKTETSYAAFCQQENRQAHQSPNQKTEEVCVFLCVLHIFGEVA